ncbi:hypothetical protein ACFQ1A_29280, partial [Massilia pinisoli]|uniref:hypothetical protein n=1 Tax=Massilia pinisoli TaxID=1772194 RepID=UPI00362F093F
MLLSRIIASASERERFALIYQLASRGHKEVSAEYLEKSKIRVFYFSENPKVWKAGYVINTEPDFRYFEVFDNDTKNALLAKNKMSENDIAEVTCIWIESKGISTFERLQVYFQSMIDGIRVGKSYIFGGSTERKVMKLQKEIMPHDFASGEARIGDELTEFSVYFVGRWESLYTMTR